MTFVLKREQLSRSPILHSTLSDVARGSLKRKPPTSPEVTTSSAFIAPKRKLAVQGDTGTAGGGFVITGATVPRYPLKIG
jgi:hypothetical protein